MALKDEPAGLLACFLAGGVRSGHGRVTPVALDSRLSRGEVLLVSVSRRELLTNASSAPTTFLEH